MKNLVLPTNRAKAVPEVSFPSGSVVKNPPANAADAGDASSVPGSGRSPGVGNDYPLQYSCLGKPMNRGAWKSTVRGSQIIRRNTHTQIGLVIAVLSAVYIFGSGTS